MSGLEALIQGIVGPLVILLVIFFYKNYKRKKAEQIKEISKYVVLIKVK